MISSNIESFNIFRDMSAPLPSPRTLLMRNSVQSCKLNQEISANCPFLNIYMMIVKYDISQWRWPLCWWRWGGWEGDDWHESPAVGVGGDCPGWDMVHPTSWSGPGSSQQIISFQWDLSYLRLLTPPGGLISRIETHQQHIWRSYTKHGQSVIFTIIKALIGQQISRDGN